MLVINKIMRRLDFNYIFASTLGVGILGRISLFTFLMLIPVKRVIKNSKKLDKKLRLQKFGKQFQFHISDQLDIPIIYDIFVAGEYDVSLDKDPKVIVDLGSNVGGSLLYFTLKYPDAIIYGFEPDPYAYEVLKSNVDGYKNICIEQAAITCSEGEVAFYADPDSTMSSSLLHRVERQEKVLVKAKTLDSIMKEHAMISIDLLKFDVEGAEYDVFKDFRQMKKIDNFVGELHIDLIDVSKKQFLSLFSNFNIEEELLELPSRPNVERYILCGHSFQ